jgi:hypothetical protein
VQAYAPCRGVLLRSPLSGVQMFFCGLAAGQLAQQCAAGLGSARLCSLVLGGVCVAVCVVYLFTQSLPMCCSSSTRVTHAGVSWLHLAL